MAPRQVTIGFHVVCFNYSTQHPFRVHIMKKQKAMEIEREDLNKAKNLPTGMIQDSNH